MTTKNPKTLWWWQWLCLINSSISACCPDKRLRLSEYKSKAELNNRSLACGRCWLQSDWYCIGCQNKKISPNINTIQYPISVNIAQYPITQYQYRSNPNEKQNILTCLLSYHTLGVWPSNRFAMLCFWLAILCCNTNRYSRMEYSAQSYTAAVMFE